MYEELLTTYLEYLLDVELWHYGSRVDWDHRMEELRQFVVNSNGNFFDYFIGTSLSVARVKLSGNALNRLLDVGIVQTIDFPPAPDLRIGEAIQRAIDDFPNPIDPPPDDAPGICIIDSGIATGHPVLGPAVGDTVPFPPALKDGNDECGHGTMVAGIALYGDVQQCIDSLNFTPKLYLLGARVTNSQGFFDDEKLIIRQMDSAIRYFHANYGCRVYNISLGDPELVYDGGKPSQWAQVLDDLVHELDIVVVVSAGNYAIHGLSGDEADHVRADYPHYLFDATARILEPATAANVITVGALAHTDASVRTIRYPHDPAYRCIAGINQASPFTRCGPGVGGAIKPEVCEFGGNATWDGRLNRILTTDTQVGIVSTSNQSGSGTLFAADVGTSYAAPKIAHVAGKIFQAYPGISANLVRALIANSSSYPEEIGDSLDDNLLLRLYGYGRPNLEKALYSTDNRVTLVAEDSIQADKFHIYPIPIPDAFKATNGQRYITVCLAFDPTVRYTRKEYLGIKMDFHLLREITTENIIEHYSSRARDVKVPPLDSRYQCDMNPLIRLRSNGTLQKATFRALRNRVFTRYEGDIYHLVVICKTSSWISGDDYGRQNYGLAITLENMGAPLDLYHSIEQRIRPEHRIRV